MPAADLVRIDAFALGDFQSNSYVVRSGDGTDCWVIDCGQHPQPLIEHIQAEGLTPAAILLTHAHYDHIAGLEEVRRAFPGVETWGHPAESAWFSEPSLNLSQFIGMPMTAKDPEHWFEDGQTLELDGVTWRVVHTPGHSPGSVVFVQDDAAQAVVGDTLFAGSIGRIDFPTSDPDAMRHSVLDVLMGLPDETAVHPGHGPSTTIGRERAMNPFVVQGF